MLRCLSFAAVLSIVVTSQAAEQVWPVPEWETAKPADAGSVRKSILAAVSELDRAAVNGTIHKNNASRRKSRLMKKLAALEKKS